MSSSRRSTHFWSEEETDFLLQTLKEMNIDRYRDGRKHRNSLIFRKVCARHKEAGFARSCDQVKHRWKTLKSIYYKAKKQNNGSSNAAFKHFDTMEEIFGHRPLVVMTNQSGADIDLKDGSPLSDSKCFTFEDAEDAEDAEDDDADNGVDDVEGGIQEIQSVKTENEPLILTQASHESSTTRSVVLSGVLKRRRPCCAALHSQYQGFLERLQQSQNAWLERQLEQSHVREERLIARVLAEHTRSMEALVNQLFAGLRSLLPPSHPSADPQTTHTALDVLSTRTGVSTAEQQSSSSGTES
ncbi:Zinc finger and SCAN domain-containing protein 20 [Labeo rohita]|uniref:Zinc finger and SCAN domain-containing protein 20 n=1 Tax=Labeo rohita TaxID=84645 RepID=A0ABQ8M379_LABRO|nr:Zinc finger and SCAN domain-containing protein 20 [Labeo rohita]